LNRNLILVGISLFFWGIGEGFFLIFQPLYLQELGASPVLIGTILGAMGIAMAVLQIPAGYLTDKVGPRPVMWASWVLGSSAAWVMALSSGLSMFIIGLFLYGMTSFVVAPMNAYISSVRGTWSVGRALTFISAIYNFGAVLGPIAGGYIGEKFGLKNTFIIGAVVFILSTAVIFFVKAAKEVPHTHEVKTNGRLWHNRRFLVLVGLMFFTMLALYLPQPLTPNYLQNVHRVDTQWIGILAAIGNLGNALVTLFLGSMNPVRGFLAGQLLVGIFSFTMWRGTNAAWFGIGYFCLGGYRLCRSMALANTRPLVRATEVGLAFGMIETANAAAIILAPVLAGFLYNQSPPSIYAVALLCIAAVMLINILVLPRLRQPDPQPSPG